MDKTKETGNQVYRSYKDRLFRMVFREKKELLGLYNAVNGTSYTDPEASGGAYRRDTGKRHLHEHEE